ncbi:hypothetical protein D3C75_793760 [compost metagenome]
MGARLLAQHRQRLVQFQHAGHALLRLPLLDVLAHRPAEAEAFEHHRIEIAHQTAEALLHLFAGVQQALADRLDLLRVA